ncbi:hypothetical protein [Bacteroides ovatus]|uniref:hypothetical protein n=1 Tax=Bacteroides ovatus TaxID=28116 RepID=UPI002165EB60|nr:hypothetical protein [Bacteroides ovatus]MCS2296570.1 hypothetical protein [Bacteroides ovatus]
MMKNFKKYTLIACSLFTLAACDLEIDITNPGLITEEKPDRPQAGETITYRAQVWVERKRYGRIIWRRTFVPTESGSVVPQYDYFLE